MRGESTPTHPLTIRIHFRHFLILAAVLYNIRAFEKRIPFTCEIRKSTAEHHYMLCVMVFDGFEYCQLKSMAFITFQQTRAKCCDLQWKCFDTTQQSKSFLIRQKVFMLFTKLSLSLFLSFFLSLSPSFSPVHFMKMCDSCECMQWFQCHYREIPYIFGSQTI